MRQTRIYLSESFKLSERWFLKALAMKTEEFLFKSQSLPASLQEVLDVIVNELFEKYNSQQVEKPELQQGETSKDITNSSAEDFNAP